MAPVKKFQCEDWAQAVERSLAADKFSSEAERGLNPAFLRVYDQHVPLIDLLDKFTMNEDGILFNRKLRNLEEMLANMCPDEVRLEAAFSSMRSAALRSAATARRLTTVGVSISRRQRQDRLRGAFLNAVLQDTFNNIELLQRGDQTYLVNAANLMGDYFAEARLYNGGKMSMLAAPLLQFLRALLAAGETRTHRALATQLMKNGRDLIALVPRELDDFAVSIRLQLLSPTSANAWLLLCSDMCLLQFQPLPEPLERFYSSHIDFKSEGTIEATEVIQFQATGSGGEAPSVIQRSKTYAERLDLNSWRENLEET